MAASNDKAEALNVGQERKESVPEVTVLQSFQTAARRTNPLIVVEHTDEQKKKEAKQKTWEHDILNLIYQPIMVGLIIWNMNFATGKPQEFWWDNNTFRFMVLYYATMLYFVVDTIWICAVPVICKHPGPIYAHHIVAMMYLTVPLLIPEMRWFMGACLIVEGNTWFLMVRRYHNPGKVVPFAQGTPLFTSLRIQLVIGLFHSTWIIIRVFWYPILEVLIIMKYIDYSRENGWFNLMLVAPFMHALFVYLNLLWSYELYCVTKKGRVDESSMDL